MKKLPLEPSGIWSAAYWKSLDAAREAFFERYGVTVDYKSIDAEFRKLFDKQVELELSTLPTRLVLALALRANVRPRASRGLPAVARGAKAAAFKHIEYRAPEPYEEAKRKHARITRSRSLEDAAKEAIKLFGKRARIFSYQILLDQISPKKRKRALSPRD